MAPGRAFLHQNNDLTARKFMLRILLRPVGRVVPSADREHSHCIPSNDGYSNGCPCQRFGVGIASGEGVCSQAAFAPVPSFGAFCNKHVRAGPYKAAWAHHERGCDAGSCYHVCSGGRRDCKGTHLTSMVTHHQRCPAADTRHLGNVQAMAVLYYLGLGVWVLCDATLLRHPVATLCFAVALHVRQARRLHAADAARVELKAASMGAVDVERKLSIQSPFTHTPARVHGSSAREGAAPVNSGQAANLPQKFVTPPTTSHKLMEGQHRTPGYQDGRTQQLRTSPPPSHAAAKTAKRW